MDNRQTDIEEFTNPSLFKKEEKNELKESLIDVYRVIGYKLKSLEDKGRITQKNKKLTNKLEAYKLIIDFYINN